ncbi:glycosyltransferase [Flavisolibacter tropicus]|uniref:Glycosyl transferase family 1 n=1 Tax=Flavisolibacter tropicus TaxID=1492898 RepID=A0A172TRH9_9BACT|nr:glycosyltransferase [Flavisolibacter tropicus]ANE49373.1 glycosyl transferase family 1 [Flavisolibacter tropicus]
MQRIVIIGPAYPLRGGLATFNQRLALEFIKEGHSCELVSFSLQYPSILFPGKTQYSEEPAPTGLTIHSIINSISPTNWLKVGKRLRNERPDFIIVRFWIPFMGPALGTILRQVKKNRHTKVICIADNVIPHEHRPGDRTFTRYFLKACDGFITMSEKVMSDLRQFENNKPAQLVQHPLYDNFGEKISKEEARSYLKLSTSDKIILFFGFIRKYKGLDLALQAMTDNRIKEAGIKLMIAGEFYEDEKPYLQIIKDNHLEETVILKNQFIQDQEVKYYLCAADMVVQPYRNATQSGVTPLAYHFEKPMVVTNVGGLPDLVPDHKVGLVCEPQPKSIADAILEYYQLGEDYFIPHLRTEKQKYAWTNLTKAIKELVDSIPTK